MSLGPIEFHAAHPEYVARAHRYATDIIDQGLTGRDSAVQVAALVYNQARPGSNMRIDDLGRIADLRHRKSQELVVIEADVAVEGARLAIYDTLRLYGFGRRLRTWLYVPDTTTLTIPRVKLDDAPPAEEAGARSQSRQTRWIESRARSYLGNLVIPGYVFCEGNGFVDSEREPSSISTYVYGPQDVLDGHHTYHQHTGVGNVPAQRFREAFAPPYTPEDAKLLEGQGLPAYHAAKIGLLLANMQLAAAGPE